jgi:hypothetical protein
MLVMEGKKIEDTVWTGVKGTVSGRLQRRFMHDIPTRQEMRCFPSLRMLLGRDAERK